MILGKITKGEKTVGIKADIYCNDCKKKVPGGLRAEQHYSKTKDFESKLSEFIENYLCGRCRDKKRVEKGF